MTKIIQQQSSRGGIGEQYVYLPNLVVYLNYSDINELCEIGFFSKLLSRGRAQTPGGVL